MAKSPLEKLFDDLRKALDALEVRWYVFGAQAAIAYGASRLTADVDVTLDLQKTAVSKLLLALHKFGFEPQIPDRRFVEVTRVIPIVHIVTGFPVDLVLAGPGLEDVFFERRVTIAIGKLSIPFASAEDIVVMKVLSGRPKDEEDIESILAALGDRIDRHYIKTTLAYAEKMLDQSDLVSSFHNLARKVRSLPKRSRANPSTNLSPATTKRSVRRSTRK